MDTVYDIKLKNGNYYNNVIICDEFGTIGDISVILEHIFVDDDKTFKNETMRIYKDIDENCDIELTNVQSDDIEYICRAYKERK